MVLANASETINNYSNRIDLFHTSTFAIIAWLSRADPTRPCFSCQSKTKSKWKASSIDSLFLFNTEYSLFSRSIYRPIIPARLLPFTSALLGSPPPRNKLNSMFPSAIIPISLSNVSLKFLSQHRKQSINQPSFPFSMHSMFIMATESSWTKQERNEPTRRIATQTESNRRYQRCKNHEPSFCSPIDSTGLRFISKRLKLRVFSLNRKWKCPFTDPTHIRS